LQINGTGYSRVTKTSLGNYEDDHMRVNVVLDQGIHAKVK